MASEPARIPGRTHAIDRRTTEEGIGRRPACYDCQLYLPMLAAFASLVRQLVGEALLECM
jgi:hypothetical protein